MSANFSPVIQEVQISFLWRREKMLQSCLRPTIPSVKLPPSKLFRILLRKLPTLEARFPLLPLPRPLIPGGWVRTYFLEYRLLIKPIYTNSFSTTQRKFASILSHHFGLSTLSHLTEEYPAICFRSTGFLMCTSCSLGSRLQDITKSASRKVARKPRGSFPFLFPSFFAHTLYHCSPAFFAHCTDQEPGAGYTSRCASFNGSNETLVFPNSSYSFYWLIRITR